MAKSAEQIAYSIGQNVKAADPSNDVTKGPFYDAVVRPPSTEIAAVASEAERVGTLYSRMVDVSNSLNATEIDALGRAFSVVRPTGTRAKVLMIFAINTRPTSEIIIPAGTPVATSDGQYIFTTLQTVRGIDSTTIAPYYDAASGKYLIPIQAVAVAEGTNYNLSAYRITRLLATVPGVSSVYNPNESSGGVSPYTSADYLAQIQASFYGRDLGSLPGLAVEMQRRGISVQTLFVDSTWTGAFTRPAVGPAVDIYMADPQEAPADELYTPSGAQSILLNIQPVTGVDAVFVNGKLLDAKLWSVTYDLSTDYGRSSRAQTKVNVPTSSNSDVVRIQYRYAGSVHTLQQSLDEQDIMGADLLPRILRPLAINVVAEVSCSIDLLANVKASLQYYLTQAFVTVVDPKSAAAYLRSSYPDLRQVKWLTFDRLGGSDVSPIDVLPGYQPYFQNAVDFSVTIARS